MKRNMTLPRVLSSRDSEASSAFLEHIGRRAGKFWRNVLKASQRRPRSLRLCESLSLGDRRFIAVVEYEGQRFLVGGTSGSLVLLANLNPDVAEGPGTMPPDAPPKSEAAE